MSAGFFAEPQRPRFGLQHAFRDCDSDSGLQRLLGRRGIGRIAFQQDPGADAVYLRFVHDAGRILNPALFEGQVRGGFAMAIGAALYERFVYTDTAVS